MIHLWRSQKDLDFEPPPTSSPLYTIIQFWNFDLSRSHSWTSLIRIQNPPASCPQLPWVISNSFLTANAYNIYYSHMYNKTDRKAIVFHQSDFLWKSIVTLVFPLQNYKSSTKEVSGWKQCNRETESVVHRVRKIPSL